VWGLWGVNCGFKKMGKIKIFSIKEIHKKDVFFPKNFRENPKNSAINYQIQNHNLNSAEKITSKNLLQNTNSRLSKKEFSGKCIENLWTLCHFFH
jgi:hypothetical protein